MGTFELLIVFAALMAVISLVAIAIDWLGRPLRNRRFIPRIYRYDDELVPDAALLDTPLLAPVGSAPMAGPPVAGPPVMMGPLPPMGPAEMTEHPEATMGPNGLLVEWLEEPAEPAPQPPTTPASSGPANDSPPYDPGAHDPTTNGRPPPSGNGNGSGSSFQRALLDDDTSFEAAHDQIARTVPQAAAPSWHPGMRLDARVGERKATVAVKAERFWKAAAAHLGDDGHFDERSRSLMAEGKPPRRRNPRTGDVEVMELVGLRAASERGEVRMRWPDDAVDPWSPS